MNNGFDMIQRYSIEFIQLALEVGIDGAALLKQLPPTGHLLTGFRVPVIHPKYRYACSVIMHINQTKQGQHWPLVKFHSFKNGGETRVFNGLQISRQHNPIYATVDNSCIVKFSHDQSQINDTWRMANFLKLSKLYFTSQDLAVKGPWLNKRLCGHATPALIKRIFVRQIDEVNLLAPLSHPLHGLVGYHKISIEADGDKKRHHIHSAGLFKGSYIEILPQKGITHNTPALCEGLATGLTIALIWTGPVYIALSANNLGAVRNNLTGPVTIFCDNDVWKPEVGNVGKTAACRALVPGDRLIIPQFRPQSIQYKPTDFNDLLMLEGIRALLKQIKA
jgi:putative DNA primase/helicase